MPARTPAPTLAPAPWWAKFVLAMLKLLLAFALAVLTLLLSRARHDFDLVQPTATQRAIL
jgi:hypothetical protein